MVILFSMSLWDKIELAAFYQPSGCWNSKCTTVVTASVTLGGICHSSFHRGEDWSQVGLSWPSTPQRSARLPASREPGEATAPLLQPMAPLSSDSFLRGTDTRSSFHVYRRLTKSFRTTSKSCVSHQADTTPTRNKSLTSGRRSEACVPNYSLNKFSVILSWLVYISVW